MKLSAASYDAGKKDNPPLYHWLMRTSVYLLPLLVLTFTGLLSIQHGSSEEAGTGRGAMMLNYALQHGFYIRRVLGRLFIWMDLSIYTRGE
jgi:hypothetical protein